MSQSPLARTTRHRTLPAFAHPPSKLSKSTTLENFQDETTPPKSNGTPFKETYKTPTRSHSRRTSIGKTTPANATSSGAAPHTPIHYSPYATSTPPAGLSKSASVPFDMASSARAARHAEADERRRTLSTPGPSDSPLTAAGVGGASGKKRFVRRKSLAQRVISYPSDLIDQFLLFSPSSFEDLLPPAHWANPIALGVHVVHFLLVAPLWTTYDEAYSILRSGPAQTGASGRWNRWEEEQRDTRQGLLGAWTNVIVTTLLVLLATANSIYLFTRFRTYDMQLRSDPVNSPNASPMKSPRRPSSGDDPFADGAVESGVAMSNINKAWRVIRVVASWSFAAIMSALGKPRPSDPPSAGSGDTVQALRVWDPPDFPLRFFCAFPPSAPLLTRLLTPLHPLLTPLLHLTSSILLNHLASSYAQLVKDRMVLSAEVMREYDRRFVYKRIFSTRVDRATQTNEAELVW